MLHVGSLVNRRYRLIREVGHGGMSVVYLASDEKTGNKYAIKEVRRGGSNKQEVVIQGLVAETELLKKLRHPNLPQIIDVVESNDSFIIVMDYIEGVSLKSVLVDQGPQKPEKVIIWARQLCDVLAYLHGRRPPIIYRDMKPSNVMLKPDGNVVLIDFGTAREYKINKQSDTMLLGTRGYASPEQFGGRGQTDARTDIYCLGATMYHLLTGYSPADTGYSVLPLGELDKRYEGSEIEKIVAKCCNPVPAARYQNCDELARALGKLDKSTSKETNNMGKRRFSRFSFPLISHKKENNKAAADIKTSSSEEITMTLNVEETQCGTRTDEPLAVRYYGAGAKFVLKEIAMVVHSDEVV